MNKENKLILELCKGKFANKEVLNVLNNSKIYRTDQNGSIMFKINKDKL